MVAKQQVVKSATPAKLVKLRLELRRLPWIPLIILFIFVFMAIFPGWISPHNPQKMNLYQRLQPPGWEAKGSTDYPLGTDSLGRDVLSRLIHGARVSLTVAIFVLLFGGGVGLAIGIISGYMGGKVDAVLMRITDGFMALPSLLIALVFCITIGPGLWTIIVAISVVNWSRFARIIRSEVLSLKEREFILQAKVAGLSNLQIMRIHIPPNVLNTFVVICSLQVSHCILTEATLSFLGAGIPPPTPTWGNMVSDGREFISSAWWLCVFPGLALTMVVFSFNTFGDWLRDRLDPKLRQL